MFLLDNFHFFCCTKELLYLSACISLLLSLLYIYNGHGRWAVASVIYILLLARSERRYYRDMVSEMMSVSGTETAEF